MWLVGVVIRRYIDILIIIINFPYSTCIRTFLAAASLLLCSFLNVFSVLRIRIRIIESVDSISKDERGFPLTQYITNGRISRGGYTFTHFKHHHRVLRLFSYSMSV